MIATSTICLGVHIVYIHEVRIDVAIVAIAIETACIALKGEHVGIAAVVSIGVHVHIVHPMTKGVVFVVVHIVHSIAKHLIIIVIVIVILIVIMIVIVIENIIVNIIVTVLVVTIVRVVRIAMVHIRVIPHLVGHPIAARSRPSFLLLCRWEVKIHSWIARDHLSQWFERQLLRAEWKGVRALQGIRWSGMCTRISG